MGLPVRIETGWNDLVFHVLAHVKLSASPANLFDAGYVRWVAEQRDGQGGLLAADASLLTSLLAEPGAAIAVQPLAVLFDRVEQAWAGGRALAELSSAEVASPAALRALGGVLELAEFVRGSALLEAETHAALPATRPGWSESQLNAALERVSACAPALWACELVLCRALTRHGRVFGRRLYLGLPDGELGVSVEQVALQAAHEASVVEAGDAARARGLQLNERALEAVAVVLLSQRCARAGLAAEHAAWAAQWGVRAEHCELARLVEPARGLATELLAG